MIHGYCISDNDQSGWINLPSAFVAVCKLIWDSSFIQEMIKKRESGISERRSKDFVNHEPPSSYCGPSAYYWLHQIPLASSSKSNIRPSSLSRVLPLRPSSHSARILDLPWSAPRQAPTTAAIVSLSRVSFTIVLKVSAEGERYTKWEREERYQHEWWLR